MSLVTTSSCYTTHRGRSPASSGIADQFDGRSVKFFGELDTRTNSATVGFEYEIKFLKPGHLYYDIDPCADLLDLIEKRTALDLEKQRLEMEKLQIQLAEMYQRLNQEDQETQTSDFGDDDW